MQNSGYGRYCNLAPSVSARVRGPARSGRVHLLPRGCLLSGGARDPWATRCAPQGRYMRVVLQENSHAVTTHRSYAFVVPRAAAIGGAGVGDRHGGEQRQPAEPELRGTVQGPDAAGQPAQGLRRRLRGDHRRLPAQIPRRTLRRGQAARGPGLGPPTRRPGLEGLPGDQHDCGRKGQGRTGTRRPAAGAAAGGPVHGQARWRPAAGDRAAQLQPRAVRHLRSARQRA